MKNPIAILAVLAVVCSAAIAQDKPADTFPNPAFPFGAVYFRKSSPPEADWERDHKTAADLGVNIFRHWFMWASIENSPGKYDWHDYDRMAELEGQNHIKMIIAENVTGAPEWMWDKYPNARITSANGNDSYPGSVTGSATGNALMCLDNDEILEQAGKFITALAERYKDKPAMMGYDLWNEGNPTECYCPASQARFRDWLKAKYGTIEALGKAWHRYSMGDWDSVHPPRGNIGYPDALDWEEFNHDNAMRLLKWRIDLIRKVDKKSAITAHGTGLLTDIEWRTSDMVDTYGYTWVASRHGNDPWMQFHAVDIVRSGARGKPFWHSEATGGPLWLQPQVSGRPLDDGRSSDDKDIRVWSMIDMTGGASGILFTRWRPLLDGPLFGAFGPMAMDGSVTPQAQMSGKLAKWANAHPEIWKSHPVKGDIGILFVQEASDFAGIQGLGGGGGGGRGARGGDAEGGGGGGGNGFTQSAEGVYQAYFDSNIQADFVDIDDIGQYPVVYLPFPEMLKKSTADKLRAYVQNGGKLICEGCPGYFGDGGRAGTVQPNLGLDQLFGARETYVQFTPDLLNRLTLTVQGKQVGGQYFQQVYKLAGGTEAGQYADGQIAAVENSTGKGKTLLIGTFPGGSYFRGRATAQREFFTGLLTWAGVKPKIQTDDAEIQARLHQGPGGTYLWVVNPTRTPKTVKITLPSNFQKATDLWQEGNTPTVQGNTLTTNVEDRNAAVIRVE